MDYQILSEQEAVNIIFAERIGCEEALTMVTTRSGQENGISIVQTRKLPEFGFDCNLSKDLVDKLKNIYQNHQHDEIPFYVAGYIDIDAGVINCNQIFIDDSKEDSEEYACQFQEKFMKKACVCAKDETAQKDAPNSTLPIVFVGHNHPNVDNLRENNKKIINNFSGQDFIAAYSVHYNARLSGEAEKVNLGMLMVNHIGDINAVIMLGEQSYKISNIKVQENDCVRELSQEDGLGVFTDYENNYDISVDIAKQNQIKKHCF